MKITHNTLFFQFTSSWKGTHKSRLLAYMQQLRICYVLLSLCTRVIEHALGTLPALLCCPTKMK